MLCFHHERCTKSHKQSQFTSKFIPASWYFQIWWIAPYYAGLLIGSGKKSYFAGFLGANSRKNRPILQHLHRNVWGKLLQKSSGKKGRSCSYIWGKILSDIDRFCADQTSVFNVFLTICSRNEAMAKPLTSWLVPSFSQHTLRLVKFYITCLKLKTPINPKLFSWTCLFRLNEGCLPSPVGNVHLSILQTVESRTPLLLSAYLWDKYSFEKSINANKVGIERGYSFEKYTFKKN